jgi:hypothetical protein
MEKIKFTFIDVGEILMMTNLNWDVEHLIKLLVEMVNWKPNQIQISTKSGRIINFNKKVENFLLEDKIIEVELKQTQCNQIEWNEKSIEDGWNIVIKTLNVIINGQMIGLKIYQEFMCNFLRKLLRKHFYCREEVWLYDQLIILEEVKKVEEVTK